MIEYLYNAIVASAGTNIEIVAKITDANGAPILSNCNLTIYDENGAILGVCEGDIVDTNGYWRFFIPAEVTETREKGRYYYCISEGNNTLCFKEPLYLV